MPEERPLAQVLADQAQQFVDDVRRLPTDARSVTRTPGAQPGNNAQNAVEAALTAARNLT